MNVPDIIGVEVITPDGRGSILTLHPRRIVVCLNRIEYNQVMKGDKSGAEMHYSYEYKDVEIIKGQYCFNDERIAFQYKTPKCTGDCGMDYCDTNGCIERKRILCDPIPPSEVATQNT